MTPSAAALDWIARGYLPVPIPFREKRPVIEGWPALRITRADVPRYYNGQPQNIGVLQGEPYGAADLDLDCTEALTAAETLAPDTGLIFGRASKPASHRFYRSDPPMPSRKYLDPTDKACLCELRCLKTDGTVGLQTVVPPSTHKETGEAIRFEAGFDREPANVDGDVLQRVVGQIAAAALFARHWPAAGHGRHECELALAGCLARAGWSLEDAEQFVLTTYRSVPNHDRTKFDRVRASVLSSFAKKNIDLPTTGFTKLSAAVGDAVARAATSWLGLPADPGRAAAAQPSTQQRDFLCNETGNADRLVQRYGDDLAHCEQRDGFMVWSGRAWRFDTFVMSERMAEGTMLEAMSEAGSVTDDKARGLFLKFISGSLSRKGLANMAHLARKKVQQVATTDFDKDPFLLNCQDGTVNLRTGEKLQHRKGDLLSKMIPFGCDLAAEAPQFLRFLYRLMGDSPNASESEVDRARRLVAYLQRLFGCAATGKPEKLLVVLYGPGNNGKSTLLKIISKALGDKEYAAQVNIASLMVDPKGAGVSNAVNSDLSDLQGCRFVFSSEVERGQRLALSRVKYLTGLTSIKTRRMRENWIEFAPTWKLFLDCNDRPVISSPTDAIWNRVKCIPFTVTLSREEIDTDLDSKLEGELPGILAWIVAGARDYVAHGLGDAPPEVTVSTEEYRESSDRLKEFIEDCCHLNPYAWVSSERLSQAYTDWCGKNGERFPLDHTNFVEQIRLKGCAAKSMKIHGKKTRGWAGIEVEP